MITFLFCIILTLIFLNLNLEFFSFSEAFLWFPWLNFWNDLWILQLIFVLLLYYLYYSFNPYSTLFYLFLILLFCGLYLAFYQLELFTAFLWVIEFTVILVSLLLLFYLNVSGINSTYPLKENLNYLFIFISTSFLSFILLPNYLSIEVFYRDFLYFYTYWDNYYESIFFTSFNDILSLTISYYTLNNFELIIVGLLLLIGSIICVHLNKQQRTSRNIKLDTKMSILNIYNFLLNSIFLRRQNLVNQNMSKISLNVFKKSKNKKVFKTKDN